MSVRLLATLYRIIKHEEKEKCGLERFNITGISRQVYNLMNIYTSPYDHMYT